MSSFDCKINVEDSIKDGLITTATTTGIFKVVPGCYGCHKTCWWDSEWCPCQRLCSLQKMDQRVIQQTFYGPLKGNKITRHDMRLTTLYYFSVAKIPLGSVTLRWANATSELNT